MESPEGHGVILPRRSLFFYFLIGLLAVSLQGCGGGGGGGDSPTRYDPGPVAVPTGLAAAAGNGEVALSWPAVQNAAAYNVYWSTSPSVDKATSNVAQTLGTSLIVTGLVNGATYYFAVTAVAAYVETAESAVVPAEPTATTPGLVDLDGTWNFNILASGHDACWMQGQASISAGAVTLLSFLDSSGNTVPPNDLFGTLSVLPDGSVFQGSPTNFSGALSNDANRGLLVGTASWRGGSNLIAVFQKRISTTTYTSGDIKGVGGNSGPKFFVYNQISSGSVQEWEFAVGKLDQSSGVKYIGFASSDYATSTFPATTSFTTASYYNAQTSTLSICQSTGATCQAGDQPGTVTESQPTATPPAALFRGIMSADKTIMVGTFSGPRTGEYALRVYQIVNPLNEDYSSPPAYDQSKPYNAQKVAVGPAVFSAHGVMELTNASSGVLSFSSYSDTIGGGMPADSYFTYTFIGNSNKTIAPALGAILTDPGSASYPPDPTFYGKVSRYSYLVAYTRTEANGDRSLTVGMQQPQ